MLIDGFYKIEFIAILQGPGGFVVIEDGKVRGGDDRFLYYGNMVIHEDNVSAVVTVKAYVDGAVTVFGTVDRRFELRLFGTARSNVFALTGHLRGNLLPISVRGYRLGNIPL